MAYLGIRGCGAANGVSQLHAQVSRKMFSNLFSRWPLEEVPVACVTNGVHVPSWDSGESDALWHQACGSDRWRQDLDDIESQIRTASDKDLWMMRCANRGHLVDAVRMRNKRQESSIGTWVASEEKEKHLFDPNVLTLGFARPFRDLQAPQSPSSRPRATNPDPDRCQSAGTTRRRRQSPIRKIAKVRP